MKTFQDYYQTNIASKLKKIDLFFKADNDVITIDLVAELLDLTVDEIKDLIKTHGLEPLNKVNFFVIMREGSSELCQLFKRQLFLGLSDQYTPETIAYIYQIPLDIVEKALIESGVTTLNEETLDALFSYIYIES